jgi:hypothetical protein
MKATALAIGLVLLVLAAGCGGDDEPTTAEAQATFCSSLDAFADSLRGIGDLSLSSSVDDVRALGDEISAAWDDVEASAADVKDVRVDELGAAVDDFTEALDGISSDTSLAAAVEIVTSAASVATGAVEQLVSSVGCEGS